MKSHNEGLMSMVLSVNHCISSKKKLNTESSTEAELVVASNDLPCII